LCAEGTLKQIKDGLIVTYVKCKEMTCIVEMQSGYPANHACSY